MTFKTTYSDSPKQLPVYGAAPTKNKPIVNTTFTTGGVNYNIDSSVLYAHTTVNKHLKYPDGLEFEFAIFNGKDASNGNVRTFIVSNLANAHFVSKNPGDKDSKLKHFGDNPKNHIVHENCAITVQEIELTGTLLLGNTINKILTQHLESKTFSI